MFKSDSNGMKIIPFNGESSNSNMWRARQKAKLHIYGLDYVLKETMKIPEYGKSSYTKEEQELRRMNNLVYTDLILSINDDVCFGIV